MSVCTNCKFEHLWVEEEATVPKECEGCVVIHGKPTGYKAKPKTNADRIRAMTDEELARLLKSCLECPNGKQDYARCHSFDTCEECWIAWLQQPAEGD